MLLPLAAQAGSCCGGGSSAALLLPSFYDSMVDLSFDIERYRGFWDQNGKYRPDPADSDLRQYRMNVGFARRFSERWQGSIMLPYVWNRNRYSGLSSETNGPGDMQLNAWFEALTDRSAWKVREAKDLVPSLQIGVSLLVPTGISPYDNVHSSFDVTGRGFYRIDGNMIVSKTVHPWNASLSLSYGTYIERPVNQEYGTFVEPYRKKLGDRTSATFALGRRFILGAGGDQVTLSGSFTSLQEAEAAIDGRNIPQSGFLKDSFGADLVYSSTDHGMSVRAVWSHTVRKDGWGDNFPATDIYTLGVSYGFN